MRDASGNVMSVYKKIGTGALVQTELNIYGSSIIGSVSERTVSATTVVLSGGFGSGISTTFTRGEKEYLLTDHRGNNMISITDRRQQYSAGGTTVDYYWATIKTASYYSTFGAISNSYNNSSIRYAFNGQRRSTEISSTAQTAKFWEYNGDVGRRWNLDPRPTMGVSSYSTFFNNPIWFTDKSGDSSIIDEKGYILRYDSKDKDLRVFMDQDGKLTQVGELGKTIDANKWYKNLLEVNSKIADDINEPWTFRNYVKKNGRWDYKNLNESNSRVKKKELRSHILGIAFYRKDSETNSSADLSDTYFSFDGLSGRAEDINNHHFGVVGKALGLFDEVGMLKGAGGAEVGKWAEEGKQVPVSWRPTIRITKSDYIEHGMKVKVTEEVLQAPYGDNPVDHNWIKKGFEYYNKNRKTLDGDWW